MSWLKSEPRGRGVLVMVMMAIAVDLTIVVIALQSFKVWLPPDILKWAELLVGEPWTVLRQVTKRAVVEELSLRAAPIVFVLWLRTVIGKDWLLYAGIALSSVIFGGLHWRWGPLLMFWVAVGGIFLSFLYLKMAGWSHHPAKQWKPIAFVVGSHHCADVMVVGAVAIFYL